MNVVFTICSVNYLASAKALASSILKTNSNLKFVYVIADKINNRVSNEYFEGIEYVEVGDLGSNLKRRLKGICVWGIEPNKYAADIAKEKLDYVICSPFNDTIIGLENQTFDCITFNDVLEHLENPSLALTHCIKLLNDEGSLVASIPNVMFFPVMYNLIKN